MNGVILLNKEINKTSRDMVNELNHIFHTKKIGHTGTLDPIATGVLVMCIGKYTKLVDLLSSLEKEYIATIKVGIKTDTLDITGNILEQQKCDIDQDKVITVLNSMLGDFEQTIPKYSAKKVNGKKLYEYARENKEITLPTNVVNIKNIELININNGEITFKVLVSKGTYIRSLISEICNRLGIIGTMSNLIRTAQGRFTIEDSYTLDDIKNDNYKILHVKELLDYPIYNLSDNEYQKVINGVKIKLNLDSDYVILVYNSQEVAIYQKDNEFYRMYIFLQENNLH